MQKIEKKNRFKLNNRKASKKQKQTQKIQTNKAIQNETKHTKN